MKRILTDTGHPGPLRGAGLLVLRLVFGLSLLWAHGWGKLGRALEGGGFADPIGLGPEISLWLAVFAEVVCAGALVLGIGGRLPAVVLTILFVVAFFVVHGDDPFANKEVALVYLAAFATLTLTGPGRYSLGKLLRRG